MLGLRSVASTARRLLPNIMLGASSSSSSNLCGATRGFRATAKMGRAPKQRVHMLRNMVTSLIEHERIKTGHVKAKQVARLAEKLVTAAKRGTLDSHRWAAKWVMTKDQLAKLFTILKGRFAERSGGYTRVLKTYPRMGDNAAMAFVEFVDRPPHMMRMPWPLVEQPTSVMPGRGGRSFRAGKRQMNDEIL